MVLWCFEPFSVASTSPVHKSHLNLLIAKALNLSIQKKRSTFPMTTKTPILAFEMEKLLNFCLIQTSLISGSNGIFKNCTKQNQALFPYRAWPEVFGAFVPIAGSKHLPGRQSVVWDICLALYLLWNFILFYWFFLGVLPVCYWCLLVIYQVLYYYIVLSAFCEPFRV